jgi:hypothetical protein
MAVPAIILVKGIRSASRIMNGMVLNMFTVLSKTEERTAFSRMPPFLVTVRVIPINSPKTSDMIPENPVMNRVCTKLS